MSDFARPLGWLIAGALGAAVVGLLVARPQDPPAAAPPEPAATSVDDARFARLEQQLARLQAENSRLARAVDSSESKVPDRSNDTSSADDPARSHPSGSPYTKAHEEEAAQRLSSQLSRRAELFDAAVLTAGWDAAAAAEVRALFFSEAEQGAALFAQARRDGDFGRASRTHEELLLEHARQVRARLGDDGLERYVELRELANKREP